MVSEFTESTLVRWIVLLPLAAAVAHGLLLAVLRRPLGRGAVITLSCGALAGSFVVTCVAFWQLIWLAPEGKMLLDVAYIWMGVGVGDGSFSADLAFQLDSLSAVMCLVVTGVGFLIHVYSVGYMDDDQRDDRGFQRFFCYLNLFVTAMLVLVLGDNLVVMFLGWEGVGLCSYLLIGFWYSDEFYAYCGSKAFIVNRIGDFGFLIGIFLLFWSLADVGAATLTFRDLAGAVPKLSEQVVTVPQWLGGEWSLLTLIGLCFFVGACGKSAQLPLYVWLPDAMAGPTPVSALIHAATMVTAGVYMVCRLSFLYTLAPGASATIAWVGALTAIFAATIALVQTDIKKVLAYSTVSQLGYMFLAAGCGAYTAAMFHVVTHAFFKALLFLGAGAIILALHHEQDMLKMGKLRSKMKRTHVLMIFGWLAIAGCPPFSGFFSKDEILVATYAAHAVPGHTALYWIGLFTAALTACYMARLYFLTFHGEPRMPQKLRSQLDDPNDWLLWPLWVLAVFSLVGGLLTPPQFWGDVFGIENSDSLRNFLEFSVAPAPGHEIEHSTEWWLAAGAMGAFVVGTAAAWVAYIRSPGLADRLAELFRGLYQTLLNKYWIDELYDRVLVRPLVVISDRVLFRVVDAGVIDGVAVNGTAETIRAAAAHGLKYAQSGLTQGYLVLMIVGTLAIVVWLVG